ncbi:phosphate uptake regulator, PhoU [Proteiniborus ethanoligenes]|uniref:Phosphate-specific transport system accessory protein PhoU n=2 Tax=Proteiniborus ethanoligenes TaxID=415015 RepID=A0A1H3Q1N0_9FIRM|nr:phosphate uptake regulator, PhoU [Proteiniborus ethanoligenes]
MTMRNRFDKELELLNTELIEMGLLIENAIEKAVEALIKKDENLAKEAIIFDEIIDEKEKDIERQCLKLLLQQQPVATDLRLISTALKMITDMERIGDHAADISEITLRFIDKEYIKKLEHVHQMAKATIKMVKDSIDAFVARDLVLAYAVEDYDDVVDDLFNTVKNELIDLIREDVNNGEQAIDFLMIAKYFERIGDHAVNIAEWVAFSITGKHKNERK